MHRVGPVCRSSKKEAGYHDDRIITPVRADSLFTYLGFHYTFMGYSWIHSVGDLSNYADWIILKQYLLPRYIHCLQNVKMNIKVRKKTDKKVDKFVKRALHLHITYTDSYFYAPTRAGELGVVCFQAVIPSILVGRISRLLTCAL